MQKMVLEKKFKVKVLLATGAIFILLASSVFYVKRQAKNSEGSRAVTAEEALKGASDFAGKEISELEVLGSFEHPKGECFDIGNKDRSKFLFVLVSKQNGRVVSADLADPDEKGDKNLTLDEAKDIALKFAKLKDVDISKLILTFAGKEEDLLDSKSYTFIWDISKENLISGRTPEPRYVRILVNYSTGKVTSVNIY